MENIHSLDFDDLSTFDFGDDWITNSSNKNAPPIFSDDEDGNNDILKGIRMPDLDYDVNNTPGTSRSTTRQDGQVNGEGLQNIENIGSNHANEMIGNQTGEHEMRHPMQDTSTDNNASTSGQFYSNTCMGEIHESNSKHDSNQFISPSSYFNHSHSKQSLLSTDISHKESNGSNVQGSDPGKTAMHRFESSQKTNRSKGKQTVMSVLAILAGGMPASSDIAKLKPPKSIRIMRPYMTLPRRNARVHQQHFFCQVCRFYIHTFPSFKEHMWFHEEHNVLKCPQCFLPFPFSYQLKLHMREDCKSCQKSR